MAGCIGSKKMLPGIVNGISRLQDSGSITRYKNTQFNIIEVAAHHLLAAVTVE